MFWKDRKKLASSNAAEEKLDRIGRELIRAAAMSNEEADEVADRGYLYQRVRAEIAAAEERRAASNWFPILLIAPRALPALALIALLAIGVGWWLAPGISNHTISNNEIRESSMPTLSATSCSITSRADCAVSNTEMLVTIFPGEK